MQKILVLLLALCLALTLFGCSKPEEPVTEDTPQTSSQPEEEPMPEEEPTPKNELEGYRSSNAGWVEYDGSVTFGSAYWNDEGNFVFQDENKIHTLSPQNEVLSTVTLSKEDLPQTGYELFLGEEYIVAAGKDENYSGEALAYYAEDKGLYFVNLKIFDKTGKLVWNFGDILEENPKYSGSELLYSAPIYQIYWLSESEFVIDASLFVGVFDIESGEGKVLHDMLKYAEEHGKFSVYYGSEGGFAKDGSYYYRVRETKGGSLWEVDGKKAKKIYDISEEDNLIFRYYEDFILISKILEDSTELYRLPYNGLKPEFLTQVPNTYPEILKNGKYLSINPNITAEKGKNNEIYLLDLESKEVKIFDLQMHSQVEQDFFTVNEKGFEFYFNSFEDGVCTYWCYNTEDGKLSKIKNATYDETFETQWVSSPNGEYVAERVKSSNNWFTAAISANDLVPVGALTFPAEKSQFTKEQLHYFELVGEHTESELYSNVVLQEELIREYAQIESWLNLSEEELMALQGVAGVYKTESPDGKTAIYTVDVGDTFYAPQYFYLWFNGEGRGRFIHLRSAGFHDNLYGEKNSFTKDSTFFVYERNSFTAFDMKTGAKQNNYGPEFDFGNVYNKNSEFQILGMGYDESAKIYAVAYTNWYFRNTEENLAEVKLALYNEKGELMRKSTTGTEIPFSTQNGRKVMAKSFEFAEGKLTMVFPTGSEDITITLSYLEQPGEDYSEETDGLLSVFGGSWKDRNGNYVSFYKKEGKAALSYTAEINGEKVTHGGYLVTKAESPTPKEYTLYAENAYGDKVTVKINTDISGDDKIKIKINTADFVSFSFEG